MTGKRMAILVFVSLVWAANTVYAQKAETDAVTATFSLKDTTIAVAYFEKAAELSRAAQYDSSTYYYGRAKAIYQHLSKRYDLETIWAGIVKCSNGIGWNFIWQGKYDDAMKVLSQALETGIEKLTKNHPDVAHSYMSMGSVYLRKGDYDRALEYDRKSLSISTRLLRKDHPDVARSYMNIGSVYRMKGGDSRALEYYRKALSISTRLLGEDNPDVARSYDNIGSVYLRKSDYDRALEYHRKALSIKTRLLGEDHPDVAISYGSIGLVYDNKGDYDLAMEYYQKALSISTRVLGKDHPIVAANYLHIGDVYNSGGDYDRALEYYRKALSISTRLLGEDHPIVAVIIDCLGALYYQQGDYDRAIAYHQRALSIELRSFGRWHPDVGESYRGLAEAHFGKNALSHALSYCQKSMGALVAGFDEDSIYANPSLQKANSAIDLLRTLTLKAKVLTALFERTGNTDELEMAMTTYGLAAELVDQMRTGYKTEGSKLKLSETTLDVYEGGIATVLRLARSGQDGQYRAAAFQFAEKSKAGTLSQILRDANAKKIAGLPDSLLSQEYDLKIDLAFYDTQLQQERQKKEEEQDKARLEEYEGKYFAAKAKYDALIERFERDYPKYYDLKYQTQTVAIADVQQGLDERTTLVEYLVGEEAIYIFTISKDLFDVATVAKDSLFESNIASLRQTVDDFNSKRQDYITSARTVYRALIAPVAEQLTSPSLVIIPDAAIAHVPFEALLTDDVDQTENEGYSELPYLLKKYAVSYAYSARLFLQSRKNEVTGQNDYLAFAPVFPDGISGDTRAGQLVTANRALDSLRADYAVQLLASRDEVLGIQKLFRETYGFWDRLFGKDKTRVLLESDADEENLKQTELQNYRYVHFATHAFANRNTPDLSGLLCARDTSSTEDNILFLPEIYNLELDADLVTLSACESGAGKLAKGEGLLSLSRGFLYAGARNLLVSLWEVRDNSTRDFMLAFYKEMLAGRSKTEALRQAKLKLMHARPHYWAPFILIGQ